MNLLGIFWKRQDHNKRSGKPVVKRSLRQPVHLGIALLEPRPKERFQPRERFQEPVIAPGTIYCSNQAPAKRQRRRGRRHQDRRQSPGEADESPRRDPRQKSEVAARRVAAGEVSRLASAAGGHNSSHPPRRRAAADFPRLPVRSPPRPGERHRPARSLDTSWTPVRPPACGGPASAPPACLQSAARPDAWSPVPIAPPGNPRARLASPCGRSSLRRLIYRVSGSGGPADTRADCEDSARSPARRRPNRASS